MLATLTAEQLRGWCGAQCAAAEERAAAAAAAAGGKRGKVVVKSLKQMLASRGSIAGLHVFGPDLLEHLLRGVTGLDPLEKLSAGNVGAAIPAETAENAVASLRQAPAILARMLNEGAGAGYILLQPDTDAPAAGAVGAYDAASDAGTGTGGPGTAAFFPALSQ